MKLMIIIIILIIICIISFLIKTTKQREDTINYFNRDNTTDKDKLMDVLKIYTTFIKPYESKIKLNIDTILNDNDIVKEYYNNILDFTDTDKNIISRVIGELYIDLFKFKNLYNNLEWNIVKVKDTLEWGMPFTLANYIFIPSSHISENRIVTLKNTLLHEQIHIFQRKQPLIFAQLYLDLGYTYLDYLKLPSNIEELRITNPDGLYINWVYKDNDTLFLPLIMMNEHNSSQIEFKGIFLRKNEKYYEPILFNNEPELINIHKYKHFINKFKLKHGLYHPNEIIAHSFTDWFLDKKQINSDIQTFFETKFIQEIKSESRN